MSRYYAGLFPILGSEPAGGCGRAIPRRYASSSSRIASWRRLISMLALSWRNGSPAGIHSPYDLARYFG